MNQTDEKFVNIYIGGIRGYLELMSYEERLKIFSKITEGYCIDCGSQVDGICHCMNDE